MAPESVTTSESFILFYLATSVRLGRERETDQGRGIEADVHQNRQT